MQFCGILILILIEISLGSTRAFEPDKLSLNKTSTDNQLKIYNVPEPEKHQVEKKPNKPCHKKVLKQVVQEVQESKMPVSRPLSFISEEHLPFETPEAPGVERQIEETTLSAFDMLNEELSSIDALTSKKAKSSQESLEEIILQNSTHNKTDYDDKLDISMDASEKKVRKIDDDVWPDDYPSGSYEPPSKDSEDQDFAMEVEETEEPEEPEPTEETEEPWIEKEEEILMYDDDLSEDYTWSEEDTTPFQVTEDMTEEEEESVETYEMDLDAFFANLEDKKEETSAVSVTDDYTAVSCKSGKCKESSISDPISSANPIPTTLEMTHENLTTPQQNGTTTTNSGSHTVNLEQKEKKSNEMDLKKEIAQLDPQCQKFLMQILKELAGKIEIKNFKGTDIILTATPDFSTYTVLKADEYLNQTKENETVNLRFVPEEIKNISEQLNNMSINQKSKSQTESMPTSKSLPTGLNPSTST